jgi:hypothetical protein
MRALPSKRRLGQAGEAIRPIPPSSAVPRQLGEGRGDHPRWEVETMAASPDANAPKTRRRSATKPASRQGGVKVKSTIHLSVEASQRLTVHAAMMGMDRSELVEQLIREHLRRFVVSDRQGTTGDTVDAEAA